MPDRHKLQFQIFYRRNLPHYQPPGAKLFVTFRLANSIPGAVIQRFLAEKERIEKTLSQITDPQLRAKQAYQEQKRLFWKWDTTLDQAKTGSFWLRNPEVAGLVSESIHHRDNKVYKLDAFCIMPNHVHIVFKPLIKENEVTYHALSEIMHSLKLYTARLANDHLKRSGGFWQHENYDHVIRDEEEWRRIIEYVVYNPVKAGLVKEWTEWQWTYCKYNL